MPGLRRTNGPIVTNDADKAPILANHFETVFTRVSSLPGTVPQSRIDVAKKEYVPVICSDIRRIFRLHWNLDDCQKIGKQQTYREYTQGAGV